jgi:hypothetical protein
MYELHREYAKTIQRDRLAAARHESRYRQARPARARETPPLRIRRRRPQDIPGLERVR